MKIKIASKKRNPLLKRREVTFEVDHKDIGGTPPRLEVRRQLASLLKIDLELVYVKKMVTKTGLRVAVGEANAYESVDDAKLIEPKYIVVRNLPSEKEEEATAKKPVEKVTKVAEKLEEEAEEIAEKPKATTDKQEKKEKEGSQ